MGSIKTGIPMRMNCAMGALFGFDPIWNESDNSITLKFVEDE